MIVLPSREVIYKMLISGVLQTLIGSGKDIKDGKGWLSNFIFLNEARTEEEKEED